MKSHRASYLRERVADGQCQAWSEPGLNPFDPRVAEAWYFWQHAWNSAFKELWAVESSGHE